MSKGALIFILCIIFIEFIFGVFQLYPRIEMRYFIPIMSFAVSHLWMIFIFYKLFIREGNCRHFVRVVIYLVFLPVVFYYVATGNLFLILVTLFGAVFMSELCANSVRPGCILCGINHFHHWLTIENYFKAMRFYNLVNLVNFHYFNRDLIVFSWIVNKSKDVLGIVSAEEIVGVKVGNNLNYVNPLLRNLVYDAIIELARKRICEVSGSSILIRKD